MTKKDTMAKLPGLFKREGTYQLRVMIPKDLQGTYGGRTKLVESLGTADTNVAKTVGTAQRAVRLAEFEEKRRELNPQRIEKVSPELAQVLAQRVASTLLGTDERVRGDPTAAKLLLSALHAVAPSRLTIGTTLPPSWLDAPVDPLEGLPWGLAAELAELNAANDAHAAMQMATQRVAAVLPLVQAEAKKLGMVFDAKTPGALDALHECLKAYRRAWQDISKRDAGEVIETPEAPQAADAVTGKVTYLRDVFGKWQASKRRAEGSVKACERALILFEQQGGNPPLQQITRAQGADFRAWLLKQDTSSKTAHDRLTWVKSLLKYAYRDLELIPRQPWSGIDIENRTESPRAPWTAAQINAFFSLPLFTEYKIPTAWKAGRDAAYWVPLLGLYTGARIGELCQLRVADIEVEGQGGSVEAFIRITDEAEGASLKTDASSRIVPVHSELVRLGFLDYVQATRQSGETSLWPRLPFRRGKAGGYYSEWFSSARKLVSEGVPDFHSFRHTARTAMTEAGFAESIQDRITGHGVRGSTGTRVYAHPKRKLREAVEAIHYAGLDLPKVYG